MDMPQPLVGFIAMSGPINRRWFMGSQLTFFATGEKTAGQFALFEAKVNNGYAVPPHTHSREDETLYVLEGELSCTIGDKRYQVNVGDVVFLPRNVMHSWQALAEPTRFLVWINPAGSEEVFLKFSEPVMGSEAPPVQGPPDPVLMQQVVAMGNAFGVTYAFQNAALQ